MRGWFDAFRSDGGPTLYSHSNRTAVAADITTAALGLVFITIFAAFLVIFPGVRKERFTTFTSVTLSLFVGTAILVSKFGSSWHVADAQVTSAYRAFSKDKLRGDMGIYIGLNHVNITLRGVPTDNTTFDVDFNERVYWLGQGEIQDRYRLALERGLPFPILTVVEYLALDEEGFAWGRFYRLAGYYGSILLWASFATWLLSNLLLVVVPRYGAYMIILTGFLLVLTDVVYLVLLPDRPLVVRVEDKALHFRFGWCYWLVLLAGVICILAGSVVATVDLVYPHRFSTTLEVDYDTPYDRHIIIEESHDSKRKKGRPRLEEPPGLGSRILRRLSKRERLEGRAGVDNSAFEMDPPKSPWRYPHNMMHHRPLADTTTRNKSVSFRRLSRPDGPSIGVEPRLQRSGSSDSSSSNDSSALGVANEIAVPPNVQRQDSQQSAGGSSVSSLGLSLLDRTPSQINGEGSKVTRRSSGDDIKGEAKMW